jgi:hypothetical protein
MSDNVIEVPLEKIIQGISELPSPIREDVAKAVFDAIKRNTKEDSEITKERVKVDERR